MILRCSSGVCIENGTNFSVILLTTRFWCIVLLSSIYTPIFRAAWYYIRDVTFYTLMRTECFKKWVERAVTSSFFEGLWWMKLLVYNLDSRITHPGLRVQMRASPHYCASSLTIFSLSCTSTHQPTGVCMISRVHVGINSYFCGVHFPRMCVISCAYKSGLRFRSLQSNHLVWILWHVFFDSMQCTFPQCVGIDDAYTSSLLAWCYQSAPYLIAYV